MKLSPRSIVQLGWSIASNGYAAGFLRGRIYTGALKRVCLPGLNCYSCPGALGSCPLGSVQSALIAGGAAYPLYVAGFILAFGAVLGRFVCGWLCPFGFIQELLYKFRVGRKLRRLPGEKYLKYLKYVFLTVFAVALSLALSSPAFCKYICPAGTLLGAIPLSAANGQIRDALGGLFWWKAALLTLTLVSSVPVWRPFCRLVCPLGALYGLFNPVALLRYRIDSSKCTSCGACSRACKAGLEPYKHPNSPECVRCGDCAKACPHSCIGCGKAKG